MNLRYSSKRRHSDRLFLLVRFCESLNVYSHLVWKVKFVGKVQDENGNEKLVRIMDTPSLFVLEQDL
jgi:hypothetical protein